MVEHTLVKTSIFWHIFVKQNNLLHQMINEMENEDVGMLNFLT